MINVSGLAIGLAASFLILFWVMDDLSYDRFHKDADSLHIVLADEHHPEQIQTFTETPGPLAEALKSEFPEIINAARVKYTKDFLVNFEDKYFIERRILGVDPVIVKRFGHYVRLAEDGDTRVIKILDEVGMKRMTIAEALDQLETDIGGETQSCATVVTYADAKH